MPDTTVVKVDAAYSPKGPEGQKYLASGRALSMRLWEKEAPGPAKHPASREYETVGYVISGSAELTLEGQTVLLHPGTSWVVPNGSEYSYRIIEEFTVVEATTPPAEVHDRDAIAKI